MGDEGIVFNYSMSDTTVLEAIAGQLKQMRLNKNISQDQIAKMAGLSRKVIHDAESTGAISLTSFVKILRVLEKLELLNHFSESSKISPLQIAKLYGKTRQRASCIRRKS
jgi:DNA-binding XRE family transcriptional regulator